MGGAHWDPHLRKHLGDPQASRPARLRHGLPLRRVPGRHRAGHAGADEAAAALQVPRLHHAAPLPLHLAGLHPLLAGEGRAPAPLPHVRGHGAPLPREDGAHSARIAYLHRPEQQGARLHRGGPGGDRWDTLACVHRHLVAVLRPEAKHNLMVWSHGGIWRGLLGWVDGAEGDHSQGVPVQHAEHVPGPRLRFGRSRHAVRARGDARLVAVSPGVRGITHGEGGTRHQRPAPPRCPVASGRRRGPVLRAADGEVC
mmetsp:Transcript_90383/g.264464  ORF Transcript_90383/g.264464 Transcript_90383/m.264464 type:complete len:255 (-) Transcript_90383:426-1190(-)